MTEQETLEKLQTTPQGLTTQEAEQRRRVCGRNKLDQPPKVTLLQRFLQQLKDPMLIILMIAAAVSGATTLLHNMQNPENPE
jgi:Ca2+-transporting ATPase